MGWQDRCLLTVAAAKDSLAVLKAMLQPENVLEAGCDVEKHPNACHLCVLNNDCSALPVHPNCRCKPKPYMYKLNR